MPEYKGSNISKTMVGNYITPIDMSKVFSILRLDDKLIELLDEPVDTPALTWEDNISYRAKACVEAIDKLAKVLGTNPTKNMEREDEDELDEEEKQIPYVNSQDKKTYEAESEPFIKDVINTAGMVKLVKPWRI